MRAARVTLGLMPMPPDIRAVLARARAAVQQHLGQPVTIGGRAVRAVISVTEAAPTLGGMRHPMTEPACLIHPDDAPGVTQGDAVQVGDAHYVIADLQPRADGWWTAVLREAP